MHELTLCKNILDIVISKLPVGAVLKAIYLEVGALAAVDAQALQFGFGLCAKGTLAEGARLKVIEVAGKAHCQDCDYTFSIAHRYDACDQCGGHALLILSGEELNVKSLEVMSCAESVGVEQKK